VRRKHIKFTKKSAESAESAVLTYCDKIKCRHKLITRYAGTENIIHRDEAQKLDNETVKLWQMLGLSKEQVKAIVGFLRS